MIILYCFPLYGSEKKIVGGCVCFGGRVMRSVCVTPRGQRGAGCVTVSHNFFFLTMERSPQLLSGETGVEASGLLAQRSSQTFS